MQKIVIIVGYNNTRVYDVERLKKLCHDFLDANIMLCRESITKVDQDITPHTLKLDIEKNSIEAIQNQIAAIDAYLQKNNLTAIACLPFSDKGIPLGSHYAMSKNLVHDDCDTSVACINKYKFRELEKLAETPAWYKKPFFTKIHSIEEAKQCIENATSALFFKPTSEGNSRGCIEIRELKDLHNNLDLISSYLEQGIIVEECIENCDEYSFEGINGNYVVTEKKTSTGYYRVETQHILPAPLEEKFYNLLIEAGKIVSRISGSLDGAVHNELFLNKSTGEVYCVEPNRRPAGMKIWDCIAIAYPGVDNWTSWIEWASGQSVVTLNNIQKKYHVGCRMLQAKDAGKVVAINADIINNLLSEAGVCEISISKKLEQNVTNILKDNSDFVGHIICKHENSESLVKLLDEIENQASHILEIA